MARSTSAELRAAQKKHGQFEGLELLVPDLSGILKGKRIRGDDCAKVMKDGFWFCAGTTLLTALGETVSGIPYGEDDGDPDVLAEIVPGSIAPVPWSQRPMGQAMFRLYEDDGVPLFSDPRHILERAMQPLRSISSTTSMASVTRRIFRLTPPLPNTHRASSRSTFAISMTRSSPAITPCS